MITRQFTVGRDRQGKAQARCWEDQERRCDLGLVARGKETFYLLAANELGVIVASLTGAMDVSSVCNFRYTVVGCLSLWLPRAELRGT